MVLGQIGLLARDNSQAIITGTATGGSTTELQDSSATFVTDGVQVDDEVVMWTRSGLDRRAAVVNVQGETQLQLEVMDNDVTNGTPYVIIRPDFVLLNGHARIRHGPRRPVLDVPRRSGDEVQDLNRKSRVVTMRDSLLYRGDVAEGSRDQAHVDDAHTMRDWSDNGTDLWIDTLTETTLPVTVTGYEVTERAANKGFPVSIELTERGV